MNKQLSTVFVALVALTSLLALGTNFIYAAEHPGDHPGDETSTSHESSEEHPGDEHADKERKHKFSAGDIQSAITGYIEEDQSLKNGYFYIYDEHLDRDWKLTFQQLHPVRTIRRDGETIYFACTDFSVEDSEQYDSVDLDFWMKPSDGTLEPYKIRIHKVDGEARYTYEDDRPVSTSDE